MISDFQKRIYNLHLSTYKKHQKKPYTMRANFDNFDKDKPEEYMYLMKLERFFKTYDKINLKLFFIAPYMIHEDQDYYSLEFYTSQSAINCYKVYLTLAKTRSPDSESQLDFIRDSLLFIQEFCINHNISLIDYLYFKEGLTFSWAVHIAEHKIPIYTIMGFSQFNINIYDHMFDMPEDEQEMLLGDITNNYQIYTDQLEKSKVAKKLVTQGLQIIEKQIKEHLQSQTQSVNICGKE